MNINDYFLEVIIEVAGYFENMLYLFFTELNTTRNAICLNLVTLITHKKKLFITLVAYCFVS